MSNLHVKVTLPRVGRIRTALIGQPTPTRVVIAKRPDEYYDLSGSFDAVFDLCCEHYPEVVRGQTSMLFDDAAYAEGENPWVYAEEDGVRSESRELDQACPCCGEPVWESIDIDTFRMTYHCGDPAGRVDKGRCWMMVFCLEFEAEYDVHDRAFTFDVDPADPAGDGRVYASESVRLVLDGCTPDLDEPARVYDGAGILVGYIDDVQGDAWALHDDIRRMLRAAKARAAARSTP